MTTHSLTLGPLVLVGHQAGPLVDVSITANGLAVGEMQIALPTWTGLVCLVDVLAAADRRHAEDRKALEAMRVCIVYARDRRGNAFDFDTWIRLVERALEKGELPPHAIEDAQAEALMYRSALWRVESERNQLRAENERLRAECHGRRFDPNMQPIISVLRDWDWNAIREQGIDWCEPAAIEALVKAMAEVERSIAKERRNGQG